MIQSRDRRTGLGAQELDARGLPGIAGGTVYPVLNRLEAEGGLRSEWREGNGGPGRKFYRITPEWEARLTRVGSWGSRLSNSFNPKTAELLTSTQPELLEGT